MNSQLSPLLTVSDLAQWLQIKESTIRRRVCEKRIPFLKIGSSVRFRKEQIEEWLKAENHQSVAGWQE